LPAFTDSSTFAFLREPTQAACTLAGWTAQIRSNSGEWFENRQGKIEGVHRMETTIHAIHYLEIVTPDVEAARQLYSTAFGWTFRTSVSELGNASVATIPGGSLVGIRAPLHAGEVPVVRTYIRVPDPNAAEKEANRIGATILLESMDLAGWGKISTYEFGGIQHGLWQVQP
jgi:predicted enzyme related to lactoylglutathione lyase